MDPTIIQAILDRQGAPNTPENLNRITQFAASNPDVLERYGMRMGPGLDDNSALLRLALDKSIAQTDGIKTEQLPPLPANGTAPAPRPAAPRAPASTGASRQLNYGPGPSPQRQMNYGPGGELPVTAGYEPSTGAPMPVPSGMDTGGGSGGGLLAALMATLVGGGAYAGAKALGAGRGAGAGAPNALPTTRTMPTPDQLAAPQSGDTPAPQPNANARGRGAGAGGVRAPAPYATDTPTTPQGPVRPTRSTEGAPAPYATDPTDPATKAALQAEIEADNARALQEQFKVQKQRETAATLKAGSRAVRGR